MDGMMNNTTEKLLEALRPFAKTADTGCHADCNGSLTQADWERAAQVYAELSNA